MYNHSFSIVRLTRFFIQLFTILFTRYFSFVVNFDASHITPTDVTVYISINPPISSTCSIRNSSSSAFSSSARKLAINVMRKTNTRANTQSNETITKKGALILFPTSLTVEVIRNRQSTPRSFSVNVHRLQRVS